MSMFIQPYVHRLSSVKVSDPGDIWVQFLKITCPHSNLVFEFFTFLYTLLIIWMQKKRLFGTYVFVYLDIWNSEISWYPSQLHFFYMIFFFL